MSDHLQRLEETHQQIQELKKQKKAINDIIKDELSNNARYKEIAEQMKTLKEEKKGIETQTQNSSGDAQKLEDIKTELQASEELLSDLAFQMLIHNESIEITDEYKNKWVPKFTVKFKKEGAEDEKQLSK